jgi:DNA repair protein RadC
LLRVGVHGENVIELSTRLLRQYGGLHGLLTAEMPELCAEHGLGQAKAMTLKAALELGRRFTVEAPQERPQITQPQDVVNLVQFTNTTSGVGPAFPLAGCRR